MSFPDPLGFRKILGPWSVLTSVHCGYHTPEAEMNRVRAVTEQRPWERWLALGAGPGSGDKEVLPSQKLKMRVLGDTSRGVGFELTLR